VLLVSNGPKKVLELYEKYRESPVLRSVKLLHSNTESAEKKIFVVRFQVLTAASINMAVFWVGGSKHL
jgi:hypothetical protein